MRSCENTSSARSRADWSRNSGAPSSAPSTTKRIWPECVVSPALIACSMRASTGGVKMRLSRQRCSRRCFRMRPMPMLPAPRCAAAAKAATAAAETAAVARTAATAAPVAAATAAATRPAAAAGRHEIDEQDDDAHKKSKGERRAEIAPQEPGQRRDEAAGGERTEAPAERRTQSTADDEHDEDQERIERIEMTEHTLAIPMRRLRFGQLLAIDQADHLVDAVGNAAGEIAALEFRRDDFV